MKKYLFILIFNLLNTFVFAEYNMELKNNLKKEYIVAVDPKQPPFQYLKDGYISGFNIKLLDKIGEKNNIKFKYISMENQKALKEIDRGKIDIILGLRFDNEITNKVKFSDTIVQANASIVTSKENAEKIKNGFTDEPFLVAVENNSPEYTYLENIKNINFNIGLDQESLYDILKLGRADFMIGVKEIAEYLIMNDNKLKNYEVINSYTAPINYYIGVSFFNENFLEVFNHNLKDLKISGDYDKLYKEWATNPEQVRLKHLTRTIKYATFSGGILLIILFTSFFWNFQLKKRVMEKTSELTKSNKMLEDTIIEIRNNRKLNSIVFESSPRGIAIINREKKLTFLNRKAFEFLGVTTTAIGKNSDSFPILQTMIKNGIFENVIYGNKDYINEHFKILINGKNFYYRYIVYPLLDYKKNNIGVFISFEDETEERLLKEQAANKEKELAIIKMIAGIAHEIRNPLTSIKTYIELLPLKKDNIKFQEQLVNVVPKEVERVNNLIQNLIDYVKPKSKEKEIINLADLVDSCTLLLEPLLSKNQINIDIKTDKSIFVSVDDNQIKQVIINLLINSIDAIKERRDKLKEEKNFSIFLNLYSLNRKHILEIKDEGIGLDENELKNIFTIFYTTKEKGSGIGLAVSKQLVERNGGKILAESKKYKYTKFSIIFEVI